MSFVFTAVAVWVPMDSNLALSPLYTPHSHPRTHSKVQNTAHRTHGPVADSKKPAYPVARRMADQDEKLATFKAIAGTEDDGFAFSFLDAHGWNVELAVNSLMGGGGAGGVGGGGGGVAGGGFGGGGGGGFDDDNVREALPQYREQLMDPALRPAAAEGPQHHPLEAFRDFKAERRASDAGERGDDDDEDDDEVVYKSKRPRNLAEIYRPPAEMMFKGSFEQLRTEGKKQRRWLLVNIQSPTEFASQQVPPPHAHSHRPPPAHILASPGAHVPPSRFRASHPHVPMRSPRHTHTPQPRIPTHPHPTLTPTNTLIPTPTPTHSLISLSPFPSTCAAQRGHVDR